MAKSSNPPGDVPTLSAGANRMARLRTRRRDGIRCYTVLVRDREVDILAQLGFLSPADRGNRYSVIEALHRFFDQTLGEFR